MRINRTNPNSYTTVTSSNILWYANDYAQEINKLLKRLDPAKANEISRDQLKALTAELETVKRRLKYIVHGQY